MAAPNTYRNVLLLAACQALSMSAMTIMITVAALTGRMLAENDLRDAAAGVSISGDMADDHSGLGADAAHRPALGLRHRHAAGRLPAAR